MFHSASSFFMPLRMRIFTQSHCQRHFLWQYKIIRCSYPNSITNLYRKHSGVCHKQHYPTSEIIIYCCLPLSTMCSGKTFYVTRICLQFASSTFWQQQLSKPFGVPGRPSNQNMSRKLHNTSYQSWCSSHKFIHRSCQNNRCCCRQAKQLNPHNPKLQPNLWRTSCRMHSVSIIAVCPQRWSHNPGRFRI